MTTTETKWQLADHLASDAYKRILGLGTERALAPGTTIISEGATDTVLYVVEEGLLGVRHGNSPDLKVIPSGDVAGEMSFLDERPRRADVYAKTPAKVIALERKKLFGVLVNDPVLLGKLLGALAERMSSRLSPAKQQEVQQLEKKAEQAAESGDEWFELLVNEAINHRAVKHPYLQAIAAGSLPDPVWALKDFLHVYYGYSAHFPRYLTAAISRLDKSEHRKALMENLLEESGHLPEEEKAELKKHNIDPAWVDGIPHPQLFRRMQEAMGVRPFSDEDDETLDVVCWREAFYSTLANGSAAEAIGALGLGTEGIVRHFYSYLVTGMEKFSGLTPYQMVFFPLHCLVDDEHTEVLNNIGRDLAKDAGSRRDLHKGMRKALNMRVSFWDWMYERAQSPQTYRH